MPRMTPYLAVEYDTEEPIKVIADERRFVIAHSGIVDPSWLAPGAVVADGSWYFREREEGAELHGPFPSFEAAASTLEEDVGPPDYIAFVFEDGGAPRDFTDLLPTNWVHTGSEVLFPLHRMGPEHLEAGLKYLNDNKIRYRKQPAAYLVDDLFPDDEDEDEDDDSIEPDDEDAPSYPRP